MDWKAPAALVAAAGMVGFAWWSMRDKTVTPEGTYSNHQRQTQNEGFTSQSLLASSGLPRRHIQSVEITRDGVPLTSLERRQGGWWMTHPVNFITGQDTIDAAGGLLDQIADMTDEGPLEDERLATQPARVRISLTDRLGKAQHIDILSPLQGGVTAVRHSELGLRTVRMERDWVSEHLNLMSLLPTKLPAIAPGTCSSYNWLSPQGRHVITAEAGLWWVRAEGADHAARLHPQWHQLFLDFPAQYPLLRLISDDEVTGLDQAAYQLHWQGPEGVTSLRFGEPAGDGAWYARYQSPEQPALDVVLGLEAGLGGGFSPYTMLNQTMDAVRDTRLCLTDIETFQNLTITSASSETWGIARQGQGLRWTDAAEDTPALSQQLAIDAITALLNLHATQWTNRPNDTPDHIWVLDAASGTETLSVWEREGFCLIARNDEADAGITPGIPHLQGGMAALTSRLVAWAGEGYNRLIGIELETAGGIRRFEVDASGRWHAADELPYEPRALQALVRQLSAVWAEAYLPEDLPPPAEGETPLARIRATCTGEAGHVTRELTLVHEERLLLPPHTELPGGITPTDALIDALCANYSPWRVYGDQFITDIRWSGNRATFDSRGEPLEIEGDQPWSEAVWLRDLLRALEVRLWIDAPPDGEPESAYDITWQTVQGDSYSLRLTRHLQDEAEAPLITLHLNSPAPDGGRQIRYARPLEGELHPLWEFFTVVLPEATAEQPE